MKTKTIIFSSLLSLTFDAFSAPEEILVWNRIEQGNPGLYTVLKVALDKTSAEYGAYQLTVTDRMEQGRVVRALADNKFVHVAAFAPSEDREAELIPIRIPVTKGLLGFRVCLVKADNLGKFQDIASLSDWKRKKITIGQGTHWPDTAILESNGLAVIKSSQYQPLFEMLTRKRFDCFSRSISEILPEHDKYKHLGLAVEPNILLVYPLPTFFFVSKKNPVLAERIQKGMLLALESGELDQIFIDNYSETLKSLNLDKRVYIRLDNPFLTPQTQQALTNEKLLYQPRQRQDLH